jgi:ketosteroid isomerase-like protein
MSQDMPAEDRLAVQDLLARYAWALDTGDYETYATLYTPDGAFIERGVEFRGRDVIREHVRELAEGMAPGNRHHNTQILFEETGSERCRLRSYSTHIYQPEPGGFGVVRIQGWYRDVCVKVDGVWLFEERRWDEWRPEQLEEYRLPGG